MMDTRKMMELLDISALASEMRVATLRREAKVVLGEVSTSIDKLEMGWVAEDIDFAHSLLERACRRIEGVFKRQPKPLTPAEQAAEVEGRA